MTTTRPPAPCSHRREPPLPLRFRLLLVGVLLFVQAGCGEDRDTLACSREDADGTYLIETETLGGDCGDLGSWVTTVRDGSSVTDDPNCTVLYERWTEGDCKHESSMTCVDYPDDIRSTVTGVIQQEDSEGDVFTGTLSVTIEQASTGLTLCTGTYAVTYTRQ